MCYFPDTFYKRNPHKKYFWRVYSVIEPEKFKLKYNENLDRIIVKLVKPGSMNVTEDHRNIMHLKKDENMKLKMALRRTGAAKNVIFLKKTKAVVQNQPTIQDFLRQQENQRFDGEIDNEHRFMDEEENDQ